MLNGKPPTRGPVIPGGILINPFDSFARDLFGVAEMERLVQVAERERVPFIQVRDLVYESQPDHVKNQFQRLARHCSGPHLLVAEMGAVVP